MSPASSGSLEVERYIGACLISSHTRSKNSTTGTNNGKGCPNRDVYYPRDSFIQGGYVPYRPRRCNSVDGWAGGMPLISFANNQRRNRRPDTVDTARSSSPRIADDVPNLSRLAVHTQGLPLILSGRQGNRRSKTRNGVPQGRHVDNNKKIGECKDNAVNGVDALSVASDESSSSNNSETSLPRIIKPRKRRKKDRKPHAVRNIEEEPCPGSSNIVTLKPYVPYCFERFSRERIISPKNTIVSGIKTSVVDTDSKKPTSDETPQLHHKFEDVLDTDSCEPSSCQCRYCDPSGQIWDVDRHCYSPFLTPPFRQLRQSFSDPTGDSFFSKKQHHFSERISSALQTFSLNCKEEVVGKSLPNRTQQCLEISTKIVTTPNGHRDLEIRLFSSFPIDDDRPNNDILLTDKTSKLVEKTKQNLTPEE